MLQELLTLLSKRAGRHWQLTKRQPKYSMQRCCTVRRAHALPGGMRLEGKDAILAALAAQPWQRYDLRETQMIDLGDAAVLIP
ncbi:MAG: hypothetical protein R2838_09815 [Caldilineaceae bacterium]